MRELRAAELAAHLAAGDPVVLIDVREPWEHQLVALPGSVLIPLGDLPARVGEIAPRAGTPAGTLSAGTLSAGTLSAGTLSAGTLVVTYCHHGVRSLSAAAMLERAGLREVASLAGGIDAWAREVDPTLGRY